VAPLYEHSMTDNSLRRIYDSRRFIEDFQRHGDSGFLTTDDSIQVVSISNGQPLWHYARQANPQTPTFFEGVMYVVGNDAYVQAVLTQ
jgi:hypothetical protein